MGKLIQYLNQFEEEKKSDNHWWLSFDNELLWLSNIREARLAVISKEYWFIEWLVDNDKIDRHNVKETNYWWEFNYYWTIPNSKRNKEIQVERLIMLISIQDNKIEFLISLLK